MANIPTFYGSIGDRDDIDEEPRIRHSYKEDKIVEQLAEYIAATYSNHYGNIVPGTGEHVDVIKLAMADGSAQDFFKVSAQKYISRFGKKDGNNEKDLFKALHYVILMIAANRLK